ncbi:hypothetical protein LSE51_000267 [Campylobacter coli]|nr:hypothetical protein [Campylobacter coli]
MSYENFIGKQEKFTENINEKQVQKIVATLQSKQLKKWRCPSISLAMVLF